MKIAIHHRAGSFSDRWIAYCKKQNIPYKVVNVFDSNIIEQVKGCDIFMWHHHHGQYKDVLTAKRIIFALEHAGVKVFRDFKTGWHFDDKVAQRYLLEALGAPLVPSYVFYDRSKALAWAKETEYPKVFKLKGGASTANVKLVNSQKEAKRLITNAFGKGFTQYDRIGAFKERLRKVKEGKAGLIDILKGLGRLFIKTEFAKRQAPENGYLYFQDFIPNNDTDFRIKVVGNRCWGFQRRVRGNDFRASGSGDFIYNNEQIPASMIELSFKVARDIRMQSVAFDLILDEKRSPLILEVSYGFGIDDGELNNGYLDEHLGLHEERFSPQEWMIEAMFRKTTT